MSMQRPHSDMDEQEVEYREKVETAKKLFEAKESQKYAEFYEFIKHGDEAHQAWILGAIEGFFKVKIQRHKNLSKSEE
jgi:HSP90 family molecular chaperone